MKYLALIYQDEKVRDTYSKEDQQALYGRFMEFNNAVRASGQYVSGNPLQRSSTGTTVRASGGKTATTDGPYAETKEQLGGYFLFECKDLDEAIDLGKRIVALYHHPGAAVEIRPVMQMG